MVCWLVDWSRDQYQTEVDKGNHEVVGGRQLVGWLVGVVTGPVNIKKRLRREIVRSVR